MPRYIVKPCRDHELYCVWSTISDAMVYVGSRDQVEAYCRPILEETLLPEYRVEARTARAEKTGTSAMDGEFGFDDQSTMIVQSDGGFFGLHRSDLYRYAEHILHDRYEDAAGLLFELPDDPDDPEEESE